jgi:hypothetical protein
MLSSLYLILRGIVFNKMPGFSVGIVGSFVLTSLSIPPFVISLLRPLSLLYSI